MTAIELIIQERTEQIEKHNRSLHYDKMNNSTGQLPSAVVALIENDSDKFSKTWDKDICNHMISKPYKERLVIAAALLISEIERIS